MAERLPDRDARRRAATDFTANLVVIAGAGTGKTSLLIERVLNAVGSGYAELSAIGAITFTEKAAGEMRERLADGLERLRALACGEVEPDEKFEADRAFGHLERQPGFDRDTLANRSLAAMEQVDGRTVTTIHGFCAELLRTHPVESGVDPGFDVDNGDATEPVRRAAWDAFVARELGAEPPRREIFGALLDRLDLADVHEIARGVAGFKVPQALLRAPWSAATAPEALGELADGLADEIETLLDEASGIADLAGRRLAAAARAMRAWATGGPAAFRKLVAGDPALAELIAKEPRITAGKKVSVEHQETMNRLGGEARRLLRELPTVDDALARQVLEAVAPFADEFRERYLRQGLVDFDGLLALARDLLRDHPAVRRQIKQRYRMLLIDEFQDTDPVQYEIVLFLAEGENDEASEPYAAKLQPGRLFVVGDPKQSIYRFRGADYSAYDRAVRRIVSQSGARLSLTGNFRSVGEVTEPVNRLFADATSSWQPSAYQPDYDPIQPVREPANDGPRVEIWTLEPGDEKANAATARAAEGRLLADSIERWVNEEGRCGYGDITILLRAFTDLDAYLRPLRARGVPFVLEGGKDFFERPEVTQFLALLRAVLRPADATALLAFLRSPAGAVSDVELADYSGAGGRWAWSEPADAARFPSIARGLSLLAELADQARALPPHLAVRRILDRTQVLPLGAAAFEGAQRIANLEKLTATILGLARDGSRSLAEIVDDLADERRRGRETDRPLADDAATAVRISTIHAIKGLENEVIVIPDLARSSHDAERPGSSLELVTVSDDRAALAMKIADRRNSTKLVHDWEDRRHDEAQEVRLFYVALTRARERLVLLVRKGSKKSPWITALAPWGFDVKSPPDDGELLANGAVVHRSFDWPPRAGHADDLALDRRTGAVTAYERAVEIAQAKSREPFALPSGRRDEDESDLAGRAPRSPREPGLGLSVGRVLHRLLEQWDGTDRSVAGSIARRLTEAEAADGSVDPEDLGREVDAVFEAFSKTELATRFATCTKFGREIPLLLRTDDATTYRGTIDLLYEDADGSLVVADYKTDHESRRAALLDRHGEQLRIYATAVRQALALDRPPRAELWMLRGGARIVVDPEGF